jgi:hypothetical protein
MGGLFERSEFETPIHGDEPNLAQVSDPELRARLFEIVSGEPLSRCSAPSSAARTACCARASE